MILFIDTLTLSKNSWEKKIIWNVALSVAYWPTYIWINTLKFLAGATKNWLNCNSSKYELFFILFFQYFSCFQSACKILEFFIIKVLISRKIFSAFNFCGSIFSKQGNISTENNLVEFFIFMPWVYFLHLAKFQHSPPLKKGIFLSFISQTSEPLKIYIEWDQIWLICAENCKGRNIFLNTKIIYIWIDVHILLLLLQFFSCYAPHPAFFWCFPIQVTFRKLQTEDYLI